MTYCSRRSHKTRKQACFGRAEVRPGGALRSGSCQKGNTAGDRRGARGSRSLHWDIGLNSLHSYSFVDRDLGERNWFFLDKKNSVDGSRVIGRTRVWLA